MRQYVVAFCVVLFVRLASAQTTVQEWQAQAVKAYPDLGIKDSPLNAKFVALVNERKQTNPEFFKNSKWPFLLATEAAGPVAALNAPAQQKPLAPPAPRTSDLTESQQEVVNYVLITSADIANEAGRVGFKLEDRLLFPPPFVKEEKERFQKRHGVLKSNLQLLGKPPKLSATIEFTLPMPAKHVVILGPGKATANFGKLKVDEGTKLSLDGIPYVFKGGLWKKE